MAKVKPAEKVYVESSRPVKYSSASTRYASLQNFMGGAEFTEINKPATSRPDELPVNLWALNIRSGVNQHDLPSKYGSDHGLDKVGNKVFDLSQLVAGFVRKKGEPV